MNGIELCAVGHSLPTRRVTNDDMTKIVDTDDEWIRSRSGIGERLFCQGDETVTGLSIAAAREALENSDVPASQIGACIVATMTSDWATPATACLVAQELGIPQDIPCFDLSAACTGFIYALRVAQGLLTPERPYGIVVGAEAMSRALDFTDRSTCVLFGDGAGAAVVHSSPDASLYAVLGSAGNLGALNLAGINTKQDVYLRMNGKEVFRFAVQTIPACIERVLVEAHATLDEVDWVVCHQANERIIDAAVKRLGADPSRFYKNMEHYGNTGAASIPIALNELVGQGMLRNGMQVLCVGFGGGLTWGGTLIRYRKQTRS
jgi:3-oxoacyl-[acyl-carrier-protein] synthase-3